MINKEEVLKICDKLTQEGELFVVEVNINPNSDIEVVVDSDQRVSLDLCADLNKKLQAQLDLISDDYSLIVASAGIGSNLANPRQLTKTVGKAISVLMLNGEKIIGDLIGYDSQNNSITVQYEDKIAVEGKKKKELVTTERSIQVTDTKSIIEELKIK